MSYKLLKLLTDFLYNLQQQEVSEIKEIHYLLYFTFNASTNHEGFRADE